MAFFIVGTAGHIDHGKSSLIKSLTGVDPDRFAEEKRRGMTIDLGFAHLALPSGNEVGFVDVPGHEKFIRNMLAGAAGIDLVLLVVAADEGIMPQTEEHFEILNLLGVKNGIVALTKVDLAEDSTWLELIEAELREKFENTFLEDAPIIRFSALTGQGQEELIKALDEAVKKTEPKKRELPARFPVDWVFSKPGFGTVVRGTLWEGEIKPDEQLLLLPQDQLVRIRGIQSFGKNLEKGIAGQRLALNLASITKQEIKRGDVLVEPGSYKPTYLVDCELTLLPRSLKLKQGEEVLFYLSTRETMAKVRLLEVEEARPGLSYFVQFRLTEPVVTRRGDRFIIRRTSPLRTIGGGKIIHPYPPSRHRFKTEVTSLLKSLSSADDQEYLLLLLKEKGSLKKEEVRYFLAKKGEEEKKIIDSLLNEGKIVSPGNLVVLKEDFQDKLKLLLNLLEKKFKENPTNPYLSKEILRAKLQVEKPIMEELIQKLYKQKRIETLEDKIKLKTEGQDKFLTKNQSLRKQIEKIFLENSFSPPSLEEVKVKFPTQEKEVEQMIYRLINEKILLKIGSSYFHREAIEKAKKIIGEEIKARGPLTASEIKEILGSTRKYVIPLLEYLDRQRFTRRVGDKRQLFE